MPESKYPEFKITRPKIGKGFYVRFKTEDNRMVMMGYGKTKEEALKQSQLTFNQTFRGSESFKYIEE